MSLLEKIFGPKKQKQAAGRYFQTLTAYSPVFTSWRGQLYESELVRSAIDARARHISKLKIEIKGSAKTGLQSRLRIRPNDFMEWSQFLYRLSTILDMQNTAFIVPVLDDRLQMTGVYPLLPSRCEVIEDAHGELWLRYHFNNGSVGAVELQRCGIMTKFQYKDDMFGEQNTALDKTMQLIDLQNQGIQEAVKSSATYRFMAKLTNFAKAEDLAKERKRFTQENLSADAEGGGLLLFPNTYDNVQQIKSNPYTVAADQMKLIQTNVQNYFGVNEKILQNIANGDEWASFYEGAIEVFAIQFSEVITGMTFSPRERIAGNIIMATANRLQYMSNADKLAVSSQMADRGIMNRDEIREIWNLPPLPNGSGQDYTIRGEYYLLGADGSVTHHDDDLTGGVKKDADSE